MRGGWGRGRGDLSTLTKLNIHAVQPSPHPRPAVCLVCVCLSLCVVHAQCCQVPGSPCRTGPAGIEHTQTRTGPAGRSSVLSLDSHSIAVTGSWEGQCMLV